MSVIGPHEKMRPGRGCKRDLKRVRKFKLHRGRRRNRSV